ncbi:hypothetical protein ACO0SA_003619 [Hanseniaspora valbyensis]
MSISSLEINNLILQYLKENNLLLSYKAIQYELNEKYETNELSKIINNNSNKQVPFGMLINLIQKGILYSQLESIAANTNSTTRSLTIDDKIYTLQQLFEDNQSKLIYASNENQAGKNSRKRKNSSRTNGNVNNEDGNEGQRESLTFADIEQEFKTKFTNLFTKFEEKQRHSLLNETNDNNNAQLTEDKQKYANDDMNKTVSSLKPLVSYSASNFATIKDSSLLSAIKQPSRDTGFLSSINLAELNNFNAEKDINNIKMCKTIKKKQPTDTSNTMNNTITNNNSINNNDSAIVAAETNNVISLNPLQNKDLLLFHLQNSAAAINNINNKDTVVKEEEIALFNQPVSNYIQINSSKTLFASCLEDGDILLYSLPENKLLSKLSMHKKSIICCKFNESSENLISLDTTGNMILWDLTNYTVLKIFEHNSKQLLEQNKNGCSTPAGIDFLFIDNNKFMIPIKDEDNMNCVGIFEILTANGSNKSVQFLGKLKSSSAVILSMSIFSKLKLLITASDDNIIRIYKGKNLSLPTVTFDLGIQDDSILDIYTNEIEEDIFLISAITLKGCISNWILNLKNEDKEGNVSVFCCNKGSELLLGVGNDIPVVASLMHDKKYLILGQINGKINVFDISILFSTKNIVKTEKITSNEMENSEVLKKQKLEPLNTLDEIRLCYLFDDLEFENGKISHITSMDSFIDETGISYLNVGFNNSSSKIFKLG